MLQLMNLFSPKFAKCLKKLPPTFSTLHLLHRLYDVDAPN